MPSPGVCRRYYTTAGTTFADVLRLHHHRISSPSKHYTFLLFITTIASVTPVHHSSSSQAGEAGQPVSGMLR
jgi:hypothetical protein